MNYSAYKNYVPISKMTKKDNKPEWIVVHNSDSDSDNFVSIQRYHITDPLRLYENVAYHYVIERDGTVVPGRPEHYHGSHVAEDDMNWKSIGICLCGKFENKGPNEKQIESLKTLLKELSQKYNIPVTRIKPHRFWAKKKSCYGSFMTEDWAEHLLDVIEEEMTVKIETVAVELKACEKENKEYRSILQKMIQYLNSFIK